MVTLAICACTYIGMFSANIIYTTPSYMVIKTLCVYRDVTDAYIRICIATYVKLATYLHGQHNIYKCYVDHAGS